MKLKHYYKNPSHILLKELQQMPKTQRAPGTVFHSSMQASLQKHTTWFAATKIMKIHKTQSHKFRAKKRKAMWSQEVHEPVVADVMRTTMKPRCPKGKGDIAIPGKKLHKLDILRLADVRVPSQQDNQQHQHTRGLPSQQLKNHHDMSSEVGSRS